MYYAVHVSHTDLLCVCVQDVTAGDGSDYEDSGIDGLTGDSEASQHQARRYKTMSASFSVYSTSAGGAFTGSDSGSSSGAGAGPSDGTQVGKIITVYFSSSDIKCTIQTSVNTD